MVTQNKEELPYALLVAKRTFDFLMRRGRDRSGGWIVETDGSGETVLAAANPNSIQSSGYGSMFVAEGAAALASALLLWQEEQPGGTAGAGGEGVLKKAMELSLFSLELMLARSI